MTITNIQLKCFTNHDGFITKQNVIYHRKNSNGTCDKVERVWSVVSAHGLNNSWNLGHNGSYKNTSFIEIPNDSLLNGSAPYGLKAYISACEKGPVNFPVNQFFTGSHTGAIVKVECLPPPPEDQVKTLTNQIQQLTQQVANLTSVTHNLSSVNQQKNEEITKVKQDLAYLIQLLNKL